MAFQHLPFGILWIDQLRTGLQPLANQGILDGC